MSKTAKHISATPEQWTLIDKLAAEDAAERREKPDRSRFLVDLALKENLRRESARAIRNVRRGK